MTRRALLTDREREALGSEETGSYVYKTRSLVRDRIERLAADAELLAETEPELYADLLDAVRSADSDDMEPREPPDAEAEPHPSTTKEPAPETGQETENPLDGVIEEIPATVDPEAARRAILAARDLVEQRDGATKAEIVRELIRDHPLGYDPDAALAKIEAGERFRGAWWRRVVKPGLEALDDVEKPPQGASDWTVSRSGDE